MLRVRVIGQWSWGGRRRARSTRRRAAVRARCWGCWRSSAGLHARSALAARFWPDVLDESARTSLRSALSALRRSLGRDADRYLVASREERHARRSPGTSGWISTEFEDLVGAGAPRGGSRAVPVETCSRDSTMNGSMSAATSIGTGSQTVLARVGGPPPRSKRGSGRAPSRSRAARWRSIRSSRRLSATSSGGWRPPVTVRPP